MYYTVVQWPDVQELMDKSGFRENSYLVSDDKGLDDFGSSSYFVSVDWLDELESKQEIINKVREYFEYYDTDVIIIKDFGITVNGNLVHQLVLIDNSIYVIGKSWEQFSEEQVLEVFKQYLEHEGVLS